MKKEPSLIVTLKSDDASQEYFNILRTRFFPKHANYMDAHLTLFHKLPNNEIILSGINSFSDHLSFDMQVREIKNIGNGNAFYLISPELQELHLQMQKHFASFLISQDRQILKPHITVQNKVTAFKAMQTNVLLNKDFTPFYVSATGLSVWQYLDGPWLHVSDHYFS